MIEYKETRDLSYILLLARENGEDIQKLRSHLEESFMFGYEVYLDGVRHGVAFALKIGSTYSLDGYNEHRNKGTFFSAVQAGKIVVNRLLKEHTNTVYTTHQKVKKKVTSLAKHIGFQEWKTVDDLIILKIGDKNGN